MDAPKSSRPDPQALACLGALREVLSAVRNLEQLLGSMHVGPKTLASVVPEVESSAGTWRSHVDALFELCTQKLGDGNLKPPLEYGRALGTRIAEALEFPKQGTVNAKRRLHLEEHVLGLAPDLASFVEHMEMLVEATWARGLALPLDELLSSRAPRGSERPFVPIPVVGSPRAVEVNLPARMGLRALGVLVALHFEPGLKLFITAANDHVELTLSTETPSTPTRLVSHLPAMHAISPSVDVASALLARYGGRVDDGGRRIRLPFSS